MSLTCTAVHSPPRAVFTPRADSALATPRRLLTPLFWISRMIGRTLAAKASAASLRAAFVISMASARRGLPSFTLRALAAAKVGEPPALASVFDQLRIGHCAPRFPQFAF